MKVYDTTGDILGHVTVDSEGAVRDEGGGALLGWTYKPVNGHGWITEDRGTNTVTGHGTRKEALRWLWNKHQEVLKTRKAKRAAANRVEGEAVAPGPILGSEVRKGDRVRAGFYGREFTVSDTRTTERLRDGLGRPTIFLGVEGADYALSVNIDESVELLHRP